MIRSWYLLALAMAALLMLGACTSGQPPQSGLHTAQQGNAGFEAPNAAPAPKTEPPAGFDIPFPADVAPARNASAGGSILMEAGDFADKNSAADYNAIDSIMLLESSPGSIAWATWSFNVGTEANYTMTLIRKIAEEDGTFWLALANFETMRWEWHEFPMSQRQSDPFFLTGDNNSKYISPNGNAHVACLTYDGFTMAIQNIEAYVTTPPNPPSFFNASKGFLYKNITLAWPVAPSAVKYEIQYQLVTDGPDDWQQLEVPDALPIGVQVYSHSDEKPIGKEAAYDTKYNYRVRSVYVGDATSPTWSAVATGWRVAPPPVLTRVTDKEPSVGIELEWNLPEGVEAVNVYRDDELIASNHPGEDYSDQSIEVMDGEQYEYYLRSSVLEGLSEPSLPRMGSLMVFENHQVINSPDYKQREVTLDIDGQNRPFSAWTNSVGQIGFAYAKTAQPASPDDWNVGTIFGPEDGEFDEHYGVSVAVQNGTPHVFFCEELEEYNVYCAVPNTMPPADTSDWDVHIVAALTGNLTGSSAAIINGVPQVLIRGGLSETDLNKGYLMRSKVEMPSGTADWEAIPAVNGTNVAPSALTDITGRPAFISSFVSTQFNYGLVLKPQEVSDFGAHLIGDGGTFFGFDFSMAVVGGYPCIVFKRNQSLQLIQSSDTLPTQNTDWDIADVGFSINFGNETSIEDYRGKPLVSCYSEDAFGMFLLSPKTFPAVSGPSNWYSANVFGGPFGFGMSNAMTLQDGMPIMMTTVEGDIPGELVFIRSY